MDPNSFLPKTMTSIDSLGEALLLGLVVAVAAFISAKLLARLLKKSKWVMGRLGRPVDEAVIRYVVRIVTALVYITAIIVYASLVPALRALGGALVASAGITALIMGMAARSTLSNVVAGVSLAIYRPFRLGDKVSIEGEYGVIEDITLRHTIMRTWEHKRLIIPNEKIDNVTLVNYDIIDRRILLRVEFGVSYDTNLDLARSLILDEASQCPHGMNGEEPPWVRVISHGDFSIGLRLYMWTPHMDEAWQGRFWMLEHVKKRFDAEGVEIPFPYRTLVYKKDLPPPRQWMPEESPDDPIGQEDVPGQQPPSAEEAQKQRNGDKGWLSVVGAWFRH